MEKEIHEIAESLQRVSRGGENALFHEIGPEFDVPKFPIERNEMKNHLLARKRTR